MAAEVKLVLICPRCQEGITAGSDNVKCPKCEFPLGPRPEGRALLPPMTLTEQKIKSGASDMEMFETISNLSADKACSIVNDALLILETLPGKKSELAGISPLVEMSLRIGELAKAYDAFLRAGGKHVPNIKIKHDQEQQEKKKNESIQETARGKPPAAALFKDS
jgi:hypothetical protein